MWKGKAPMWKVMAPCAVGRKILNYPGGSINLGRVIWRDLLLQFYMFPRSGSTLPCITSLCSMWFISSMRLHSYAFGVCIYILSGNNCSCAECRGEHSPGRVAVVKARAKSAQSARQRQPWWLASNDKIRHIATSLEPRRLSRNLQESLGILGNPHQWTSPAVNILRQKNIIRNTITNKHNRRSKLLILQTARCLRTFRRQASGSVSHDVQQHFLPNRSAPTWAMNQVFRALGTQACSLSSRDAIIQFCVWMLLRCFSACPSSCYALAWKSVRPVWQALEQHGLIVIVSWIDAAWSSTSSPELAQRQKGKIHAHSHAHWHAHWRAAPDRGAGARRQTALIN